MKENRMLGNIQAKIERLENKLDERQKELSDLTWKYFIDESSELLGNTSLESMRKRDHYKNALEFEIMRLKCKIKQLKKMS